MRPLIWVGVLLSVHIVNAWPPSIIHCANRQSRTDILNCVKRYNEQQHLTRMSSMFPRSAANAVLMFYHHYHLWFFTLLVGRLTSQAITL